MDPLNVCENIPTHLKQLIPVLIYKACEAWLAVETNLFFSSLADSWVKNKSKK